LNNIITTINWISTDEMEYNNKTKENLHTPDNTSYNPLRLTMK